MWAVSFAWGLMSCSLGGCISSPGGADGEVPCDPDGSPCACDGDAGCGPLPTCEGAPCADGGAPGADASADAARAQPDGGRDAGDRDAGRRPVEALQAPAEVRFEVDDPAEERTRAITFRNVGPDTLGISSVRVDPPDGPFALVDPVQAPVELEPGGAFEVSVVALGGHGNETARLVVDSNERQEHVSVALVREVRGAPNRCPAAAAEVRVDGARTSGTSARALIGQYVELDGGPSHDPDDGRVARFQWTLVARPSRSTAQLTPSPDVARTGIAPDVDGAYAVDLQVYDAQGLISCNTQRVNITATSTPADLNELLIDVTWDTPGDPVEGDRLGTDMDLHYLWSTSGARWGHAPYDVFWDSRTGDWGMPGADTDDPRLERDDVDGEGPELVRHPGPAPGTYYVGVHYYEDNGFGGSDVTTRVSMGGVVVYESRGRAMASDGLFIVPARIDVDVAGNVSVSDPGLGVRTGLPAGTP